MGHEPSLSSCPFKMIRVLFSFQKVSHSTYRCTNKATGRSERLSVSMSVTTALKMTDVPDCGSYLEDRDSPMKISLRLRMGRRLVLEKLSCTFPLPGEMRCVDQTKICTFIGSSVHSTVVLPPTSLDADGGDAVSLVVLLQAQLLLVQVHRGGVDSGALQVQAYPLAPQPPGGSSER